MHCCFPQEFSSKSWDPKVQVPYKVDSGMTPRKLEIERRKRQYSKLSKDFDSLLIQHCVSTQELMPITDRTSKALLSSSTRDSDPTPVFPSFLPLEIFDNTEFDSRTPEEWLQLGKVSLIHSLTICRGHTLYFYVAHGGIENLGVAMRLHSGKVTVEPRLSGICLSSTLIIRMLSD